MSSSLKPIKAYGDLGPNPPKVIMILEELGLPYEIEKVVFADIKGPEYTAVNPNGRLPAIYDPNTDLTLWESGAIIEYLVETYDKDNKISFPKGSNESYLTKQWLYFQVSGQGPYFGQAVWFTRYHPEKIQSAVDRYVKEIYRVTGVVEGHLAKEKAKGISSDGPWLVGGKITFADIAWYMWSAIIGTALPDADISYDEYPLFKDWLARLGEHPSVKYGKSLA
ncbi:glutathione S-transferase [Xylaria bambusicola]|uniref:glutathione S-transferase n=1 Tax=Xylaria bambusicola TaxID=326684 RepID=UPI0020078786|nr:glutathione S-transferase [Xylaria bambusicola]KAI0515138.1 glutathione S-transferase [Xylaria bambusicola]